MFDLKGLGAMRGKIDLDYDVSPDPSERHRALYLYWPTTQMTGDYTCKISTLQNEVSQTKKMTVYGKTLQFYVSLDGVGVIIERKHNLIISI